MRRTGPAAPILSVVLFFLLALIAQPAAHGGGRADDPPDCSERCPSLCSSGDGLTYYCCWGEFDPNPEDLGELPGVSGSFSRRTRFRESGPCGERDCTEMTSGMVIDYLAYSEDELDWSSWPPGASFTTCGPDPRVAEFVACEPAFGVSPGPCGISRPIKVMGTHMTSGGCPEGFGMATVKGLISIPAPWLLGDCEREYEKTWREASTWSSYWARYRYRGTCTSISVSYSHRIEIIKEGAEGEIMCHTIEEMDCEYEFSVSPANTECCDPCNPVPEEEIPGPTVRPGVTQEDEEEHDGDDDSDNPECGNEGDEEADEDSDWPGGGKGDPNTGDGAGAPGNTGGKVCTTQHPPKNCNPVALGTGHKVESAVDLVVPLRGLDFRVVRHYTSDPGFGGSNLVGENWTLSPFRFLVEEPVQGGVDLHLYVSAHHGKLVLRERSPGRWSAGGRATQFVRQSTLTVNNVVYDTWEMVHPGRWSRHFYRAGTNTPAGWEGLLLGQLDQYGNSHLYLYGNLPGTNAPRLGRVLLNGDSIQTAAAWVDFLWRPANSLPAKQRGYLARVEVYRPDGQNDPVLTDAVDYWYYGDNGQTHADVGTPGDLIQVVRSTRLDRAPDQFDPFRRRVVQYRYHNGQSRSSSDERLAVVGARHQLKMILLPEQLEYIGVRTPWAHSSGYSAALGLLAMADDDQLGFQEPLGHDVTVADAAAKIVGYGSLNGSDPKVAAQYLQTSCGCSGSAQALKMSFTYYPGVDGTRTLKIEEHLFSNGSFGVLHRTSYADLIRGWPDGAKIDRVENFAIIEPGQDGRRWVWRFEYDDDRRLVRYATPEARLKYLYNGEDDGQHTGPFWSGRSDAGLVRHYAYDARNRLTEERVRKGWDPQGSASLLFRRTFRTAAGQEHLVEMVERFAHETDQDPVQDADQIETVQYEYGFHGTAADAQVAWMRVITEAETQGENGPGGAYDAFTLWDAQGVRRWTRGEDGALAYFDADPATGRRSKVVRNAAVGGSGQDAPALVGADYGDIHNAFTISSWGRSADGGWLTTRWERDLLGRVVRTIRPGGVSSYTVRELARWEDHDGFLYAAELTLPHKLSGTQTFDGPAARTWFNAAGKSVGAVEYALDGSAPYDPPALEFTLAEPLSKRAAERMLSGLVKERLVWPHVEGSPRVTHYGYDPLGRLETVTTPNGTITRTSAYDVLDRPLEVQVGTGLTNMVTVARSYYDHAGTVPSPEQGMGNGHLTLVQQLTGETGVDPLAPHTRTTVRTFDYRGRLQKVANDGGPYEYLVYDNLGRVTARGLFSADPTGGIGSAGRGLYSESEYSQRGLLHRQRVAIDPGDLGEGFLETNTWFDAAGRAVAVWSPNGPGAKTVYDGLGRVVTSYMTDRRNDAAPGAAGNYADATSVSDDRVVEQQELSYTAAGSVQLVTQRRRLHDHTGFGALTGTTGVATFVVHVYDDAQRPIGTLNYGTASSGNVFASGGSAPSPIPTAVPSPLPADVIVQQVRYNARGLVDEAIDPEGKVTKYFYDDLSRRVAVVENHDDADLAWDGQQWIVSGVGGSGTPAETDVDRMTQFVYDASGNLWKQIAHLPGGGAQTTEYVYTYSVAHGNSTDPGDPDVLTGTLVVSNDLLHEVRYPDRSSGDPVPEWHPDHARYRVSYAYNALGELRSTTDQNGTRHVYVRDGLGRVLRDWVDAFGPGIDDAVKSISVTYDAFGRVDRVRSASDTPGASVVNEVRFRYTPLWQVARVYQDHDGPVQTADSNDPDSAPAGNTAVVGYAYASSPASSGNYSRLTTLTYPDGAPVNYGYGASGGLDDRISRVFSLSVGTGTPVQLARYHRVGMDMAAIVDYPTPDVQLDRTYTAAGNRRFTAFGSGTPAAQGSYAGWDRFGRIARQAWVDGASGPGSGGLPNRPPVLEMAYGYDRASNRLFARDVRPGAKLPNRDWQYDYDSLDRLKEAKRGVWNGSTLVAGVGGQRWDLDMLGNWTEFRRDLAGNGLYSSVETRDHNFANEITALDPDGGGGAPQLPFAYDDAGNMRTRDRSPGTQSVYTHDAWNRLVKVTIDQMNPAGSITLQESEYNGLHWRTVRRLDTTTPANGLDQMRVMYYSASWQVLQEDIDDNYLSAPGMNRRAQQFWGLRYIDDAIARRSKATLAGSYALPWFYITDAQFSVVAVLNASGKLVERIKYDPYGTASHHWAGDVDGDGDEDKDDENLVTASYGSIGSGAYNADADINRDGVVDAADLALVGKNAALAKGMISDPAGPDNPVGYCGYLFNRETGLYTVRFRHYDPGLGRWLQRDPWAYVDGLNTYFAFRSNPIRFSDPSGLVATRPEPLITDPNVEPERPDSQPEVDSRNDKSQGCGIEVRQRNRGNRGVSDTGHRWIEIPDPGHGKPGEQDYRPRGRRGVGHYPHGWVTPFPSSDPDYRCSKHCPNDDPSTGDPAPDRIWPTKLLPDTYQFIPQPVITPGWMEPIELKRRIKYGPGAGKLPSEATCEDIRKCLYEFQSGRWGLGTTCYGSADEALEACGLTR